MGYIIGIPAEIAAGTVLIYRANRGNQAVIDHWTTGMTAII